MTDSATSIYVMQRFAIVSVYFVISTKLSSGGDILFL